MNPPARSVYAVILAAGESRRCAPLNKLFLPWKGSIILEAVVARVLESRVDGTAVVIGHQAERAAQFLKRFPCRVVLNPDYRSGMGSSLLAGIDYWLAQPDISPAAGFLIVLGDQPLIPTAVINLVIDRYRGSNAGIVVPVFQGRRGHPPVFHRGYSREIRAVAKESGAREVLRRHPEDILPVEVPEDHILRDIDTLEEWKNGVGPAQVVK